MSKSCSYLNRRDFLSGAVLAAGGLAMASLPITGWAKETDYQPLPPKPLRVQPVLTCRLFTRKKQSSWREWGGLHTQDDITKEQQRIGGELAKIKSGAEFPVQFLPLVTLASADEAAKLAGTDYDVMLVYAANVPLRTLEALTNPQKWTIIFVRHKSGPVYTWYEIAHNRYLRKTIDEYGQAGVDYDDVVVDRQEEILWRVRALYGLKNTLGKKIVAIGKPSGWGAGGRNAPDIARNLWKMDIGTIEYPALEEVLKNARQDSSLVKQCSDKADKYLRQWGVSLKTDRQFVHNSFILQEVFKNLMSQAQTDAMTINNCMSAIMPISETTACLPLSTLNDSGYLAFCESDFVAIPSGVLLHYISGLPVFFNDPTYPHDGVVTLAHCTAPRKMNGKDYEPVKILTHFESDYGAAPKVEMKLGQKITVIDPDFASKSWLGFEGEIIDNPFLDICRSQIDVQINGDCDRLIAETKGFHWMVCYGNYLKEIGYALKKVGVNWTNLTPVKKAYRV